MSRTTEIESMPLRVVFIFAVTVLALAGCASIFSESKYDVDVTNGHGPTYFQVRDRKGEVLHDGLTPANVTLRAKAFPFWPAKYTFAFIGENGLRDEQAVRAKFDPWVLGNVVLGGVPGIVVDGMSGAMFELPDGIAGELPADSLIANIERGQAVIAANSGELVTGDIQQANFEQTIDDGLGILESR